MAKVKTTILAVLLLISFLQSKCTNNVQQHIPQDRDEPVNLIIDKDAGGDSVYNLCLEKFASLIKNPSEKLFFELENEFDYADEYSETLLYNLVAANKLGIDVAKIRVANSLTHSLKKKLGTVLTDTFLFRYFVLWSIVLPDGN